MILAWFRRQAVAGLVAGVAVLAFAGPAFAGGQIEEPLADAVRTALSAAIEQNHDARGIIWPRALAPFEVVLCPIGYDRNADVKAAADRLHAELLAVGVDVLLDDRGERPGAMFADWELIGIPQRVVISDRGLKEGQLEVQGRREDKASSVALPDIVADLRARLAA